MKWRNACGGRAPVTFIRCIASRRPFPATVCKPAAAGVPPDTADAVRVHQADMGIAFDGDFDRCFLFDDEASFIEGYYAVGCWRRRSCRNSRGENHSRPASDVEHGGHRDPQRGQPVMSKTGHAFIKERMRQEDAIYGGEMSAHHYFRDFAMLRQRDDPWLLVAELLCLKNSSLKSPVADRQAAFPASGRLTASWEMRRRR